MANAALQRYNDACAAIHDASPVELDHAVSEAWDALPLHRRVAIMLMPAWREALHELRVAAGSR
jgi:hypothetical protein